MICVGLPRARKMSMLHGAVAAVEDVSAWRLEQVRRPAVRPAAGSARGTALVPAL